MDDLLLMREYLSTQTLTYSLLECFHFIGALNTMLQYESHQPPPFESLFPRHANPMALDLLKRMLVINPERRIDVDNALTHPV